MLTASECLQLLLTYEVELNLVQQETLYQGAPDRNNLMTFLTKASSIVPVFVTVTERQRALESQFRKPMHKRSSLTGLTVRGNSIE